MELALCQRYFEKSYALDVVPGTNTSGGISCFTCVVRSDNTYVVYAPLRVTKRIIPVTTTYTSTGTASYINARVNEAAFSAVAVIGTAGEGGVHQASVYGSSTANARFYAEFHWTANAEL